jgi:hypothetical protein
MTAHISLISGLCALIERAYNGAFCYRTRVSEQKLVTPEFHFGFPHVMCYCLIWETKMKQPPAMKE